VRQISIILILFALLGCQTTKKIRVVDYGKLIYYTTENRNQIKNEIWYKNRLLMIETFHLRDSLLNGKYSLFRIDSLGHKILVKQINYKKGLKNGKYLLEDRCVKRKYKNNVKIGKEILKDYENNLNEINWYDRNGNKMRSIDYYYENGLVAMIKYDFLKKIVDTTIVNFKYKNEFVKGEIQQLENREFSIIDLFSTYDDFEKK
jgi:hypothetical protein